MTRRVKCDVPLDASVNPYVNPIPLVRHLAYSRFRRAVEMVDSAAASRVLDFGCWAGYFLPSLCRRFNEVWGVDDDSASAAENAAGSWTILQVARKLCKHEVQSAQPHLIQAGGLALPFRDEYFDVVFCLDTLAHVPCSNHAAVIAELRRVTKQGGQLIFSLPIEAGPIGAAKRAARALTGKQSDPNMQGYGFREDLQLLRSMLSVRRAEFFPVHGLGSLNPFLFISAVRA